MTFFSKSDTILVKRLELWASEYVRVRARIGSLTRSLANQGVIVSTLPPTVTRMDSFEVSKIKEQIIELFRHKENILKGLHNFGAKVVDKNTMEILLPGGPHEGSFLSWQPGEPAISYWRMSADTRHTERQQLGGAGHALQPVIH
ncbi:MAG: hypothetical protein JXX29_07560 [Deltaproteobacteria bacterium]|nr:hypothetical protein [Deltaproteobacteria bacterium]MBN2671513.1 hypothetical protein [Deltaproteobacteria bacterium]